MSREVKYDPFESSFFTKGLFRRVDSQPTDYSVALGEQEMFVLECRLPNITPNHTLAIIGGDSALGDWDAMRGYIMDDGDYPVWRAILPVDLCERGVEFKFIIIDRVTNYFVAWELGDNRVFSLLESGRKRYDIADSNGAVHTIEMPFYEAFSPSFDLAPWRGAGVALPLFSVRTEESAGVGDFRDLRSVVDWAAERNVSVVQLLPLNDTTIHGSWGDSYPYSINSTVALHMQYISLHDVGELSDKREAEEFERRAKELNDLPEVDYEGVMALKDRYMRTIFRSAIGIKVQKSNDYKDFVASNSGEWLESYALYKSLAIVKYNGCFDFREWGEDSQYDEKVRNRYRGVFAIGDECAKIADEFDYQCFVQYHLHKQLRQSADYARSRGVTLKGDLPIGVSRCSVDCWVWPQLFQFGMQAGAPPDDFSAFGQNWGFPTYDWSAMASEKFAWWKLRLKKMSQYFDLYRIDHILGFFRMWSIPVGSLHAQLGHFSPAKPLSIDEIEAFGFAFDAAKHTTPYITDELLDARFGDDIRNRIKIIYFIAEIDSKSDTTCYHFKKEYANQSLVMSRSSEVGAVRDALVALHDEVLFVEDSANKGYYHPRIDGANTLAYSSLDQSSKAAFDAIYRDFYFERNNELWLASAEEKLPALIEATDMLVCGEDLGVIPANVAEFLAAHKILSLEVERMPKSASNIDGFGEPNRYPYLSVATTSTHDMSSLRGWWQEDREATQRYYNDILGFGGIAPLRLTAAIAERILERHKAGKSMFTIIPWADLMAADATQNRPDPTYDPRTERINDPSDADHYWRYRMPQKLPIGDSVGHEKK
ncbi:MAG: 4-alpha-glucanotransferase [Rikenellaceae bacterium]